MLRCVLCSLLLVLFVRAEEEVLKASLRFQIWAPQGDSGILIEADPAVKRVPIREELLLQQAKGFLKVHCDELRCGSLVEYVGSPQLVLYRVVLEEREEVARFELAESGEYRVILMKTGNTYQVFPIPLDGERLSAGSVQLVNTTRGAINVQQHGERSLFLRRGQTRVMQLAAPDEPAVHLTVRARRGGKWVKEFSRFYSLRKNSKTVCFFYQASTSSKRLELKLFSGL